MGKNVDHTAPHEPVLAGPVLNWLNIRPEGVYVDCTAGAGGHAARIAAKLNGGRLLALDRDPAAVEIAAERLRQYPGAAVVHANYGELEAVLKERNMPQLDGVLIDAGLSSMQIDSPARGFSFQKDGPLDMRMDPSAGIDAKTFLARISRQELAQLLKQFGDIGPAKRIAKQIIAARQSGKLESTADLARAVEEALDFVKGTPAELRTVFQAIRMAVNSELRWLEAGIAQGIARLKPGGRIVAIAFHSGEDRVVKLALRERARKREEHAPDGRVRKTRPPEIKILTPKPILPGAAEIAANPRAKSAKMRVAERLAPQGAP